MKNVPGSGVNKHSAVPIIVDPDTIARVTIRVDQLNSTKKYSERVPKSQVSQKN